MAGAGSPAGALRGALARWGAGARGRVAVAFSGGADSAALGALLGAEAAAARRAGPGTGAGAGSGPGPGAGGAPPPLALVVDHGLRPGAEGEAARAAALAGSLGLEARVLRAGPAGRALPPGRRQRWARSERYRLLAEACGQLGAGTLLTGHHADDQVETFLLRLAAGSGLEGLAAIPEASWLLGASAGPSGRLALEEPDLEESLRPPGGGGGGGPGGGGEPPGASGAPPVLLLRPLLGTRKRDLEELCRARGVAWVLDPTNADAAASRRNAVRAVLARAEAAGRPAPHADILRIVRACAEGRAEIRSRAAAALTAAQVGCAPREGAEAGLEFQAGPLLREAEPVALRALAALLRAARPPPGALPPRAPPRAPRPRPPGAPARPAPRRRLLRGCLRPPPPPRPRPLRPPPPSAPRDVKPLGGPGLQTRGGRGGGRARARGSPRPRGLHGGGGGGRGGAGGQGPGGAGGARGALRAG